MRRKNFFVITNSHSDNLRFLLFLKNFFLLFIIDVSMFTLFQFVTIFAAQCYASPALAVMRCPSVCVSVTFVHSVDMNKHIFTNFFHGQLATPFWFYRTKRHGNILMETPPPNEGVEYTWSRLKSRFSTNIWLWLAVWLSGNTLASINVVALRQTRLVLGWVTVCGRVNHFGM